MLLFYLNYILNGIILIFLNLVMLLLMNSIKINKFKVKCMMICIRKLEKRKVEKVV